MNDDLGDAFVSVAIITHHAKLEKAKTLIELSESQMELGDVLRASAVVLMATVLEQATKTVIRHQAEQHALDYSININATPQIKLMSESLRKRLRELPNLIAIKRCRLNDFNQDVKLLHELISLRNNLVHCEDATLTEQFTTAEVPDLDTLFYGLNDESNPGLQVTIYEVNGEEYFATSMPMPKEVWYSIDLPSALSFYRVVNRYVEEIVDLYWADPAEINPDSIIDCDMVIEL